MSGRLLAVLLLAAILAAGPVAAEDAPAAERLAESLDLEEVEEFLSRLDRDLNQYMPRLNLRDVLGLFGRGGRGYDLAAMGRGLIRALLNELVASHRILGTLLTLIVLTALLRNLQAAFAGEEVARVAYLVCYLVLVYMAAAGFVLAVGLARGVVRDLLSFMQAVLPLMITLLMGTGALASAGLFHPMLVAGTHVVGSVVADVVLPLILFAAACDLASSSLGGVRVRGLAALLRQAALGVLGVLLSGFLGIVAVYGVAGAVADGVSLRTAKFMAGTFIPVVGKIFSDAVEVVFGTTLVLKSALGVLGMLAVFVLTVFPLLKLVALVIIYRLAAALAGPFDVPVVADSLQDIATGLTLVGVAAAAVGLVFLVALAAMVGAGNAAVMLR
ncbi:MAG: stage III sporulation protein AE [bacterium]|nr:stage III sporulation protein AE [bacterium]